MAVLVLTGLLIALVATGCSASRTARPSGAESTAQEARETPAEPEVSTEALAVPGLAGSWENREGSVFRTLIFRADGTVETSNYAGVESGGTWTLEGDYLRVESTRGETWGSPFEWVSSTEFAWANESGTWMRVE